MCNLYSVRWLECDTNKLHLEGEGKANVLFQGRGGDVIMGV